MAQVDFILLKFVEEDGDDPLNAALKDCPISSYKPEREAKTPPTGFLLEEEDKSVNVKPTKIKADRSED